MTNFAPKIKKVSNQTQPQMQVAIALLKEKRFDEAIAEFTEILKQSPNSFPAQIGIGNAFFKTKRFEEALTHLKQAMRLESTKAGPHILAGMIYLKQKEVSQATKHFQDALNLDPKSYVSYLGLARVLARQEKYPEAIQQFKNCLRLNPRFTKARQGLAQVYSATKQYKEALNELDASLRIEPDKAINHCLKGSVLRGMGNYNDAVQSFKKGIDLNPKTPPGFRLELVESLIESNGLPEASEVLRDVPYADKVAPRIHKLWGDIYHRQGLLKEASEEYRAATVLGSESGQDPNTMPELAILSVEDEDQWEDMVDSFKAAATDMINRRAARSA